MHPYYKGGQFLFDLLEWEDFMLDGEPPPLLDEAALAAPAEPAAPKARRANWSFADAWRALFLMRSIAKLRISSGNASITARAVTFFSRATSSMTPPGLSVMCLRRSARSVLSMIQAAALVLRSVWITSKPSNFGWPR